MSQSDGDRIHYSFAGYNLRLLSSRIDKGIPTTPHKGLHCALISDIFVVMAGDQKRT
jgi:hypothetical protein